MRVFPEIKTHRATTRRHGINTSNPGHEELALQPTAMLKKPCQWQPHYLRQRGPPGPFTHCRNTL